VCRSLIATSVLTCCLQLMRTEFWLGMYRLTPNAPLTFRDGSSAPPSGQAWCSNEPNNGGGNEGCAVLHTEGCMNDLPCNFGWEASVVCSLAGGCGEGPDRRQRDHTKR
jgi:hypothetical protein